MDKMDAYISYYTGEESADLIKTAARHQSGGPYIVIMDTVFDDGALKLKNTLAHLGYDALIIPVYKTDFSDLFNLIIQTYLRIKATLKGQYAENPKDDFEMGFEIGNLDPFKAGIFFLAVSQGYGKIINTEGKHSTELNIPMLPDVKTINYNTYVTLKIIHDNEKISYKDFKSIFFEKDIQDKTDEEVEKFYSTHNNAYKIIDRLSKRGWIKENRTDKTYELTSLGETALMLKESEN